MKILRITIV